MVPFPDAAAQIPADVVLIGNVDPVSTMLFGTPEKVRQDTRALMDAMREFPNFLVSTGCDLPAETPIANIAAMVETVKAYG
jgi:uroporphyrinogen-III decarboxylase